MTTLFISDLHLQPEREDITQAFEAFMATIATEADALYILGDFFEVWLGDDDDSGFNQRIINTLLNFTQQGKILGLMAGNRDFLMGDKLAEACGATRLSELETLNLGDDATTLILHGDSLCTRDQEYMAFRQMSRSPEWQANLLAKPLEERRAIARHLREQSKSMSSNKAADIMDVTQEEVEKLLCHYNSVRMIHGHTHRPKRHPVTLDNKPAERIVLGDWDTHAWWLHATDDGELELINKPISSLN